MPTGYCTTEDVRRVMQETEFSGALDEIASPTGYPGVVYAITGLSEWLEEATHKHWYVSGGLSEDTNDIIPTSAKTRDDEHDIPSHGALVHGDSERYRAPIRSNSDALLEAGPRHHRRRRKHRHDIKREIRLATGDVYAMDWPRDETAPAYTRIRLDRKDVEAVNELHVINENGGYDDWVADSNFDGGVGNQHRGEDYWVRVNNLGVSELYLDVHSMDDDITTLSNAVYIDIDYGESSLPETVRRGVALLAAAGLVIDEEFQTAIPDSGQLVNVETKAQRWERMGKERLEHHFVEPVPEPP